MSNSLKSIISYFPELRSRDFFDEAKKLIDKLDKIEEKSCPISATFLYSRIYAKDEDNIPYDLLSPSVMSQITVMRYMLSRMKHVWNNADEEHKELARHLGLCPDAPFGDMMLEKIEHTTSDGETVIISERFFSIYARFMDAVEYIPVTAKLCDKSLLKAILPPVTFCTWALNASNTNITRLNLRVKAADLIDNLVNMLCIKLEAYNNLIRLNNQSIHGETHPEELMTLHRYINTIAYKVQQWSLCTCGMSKASSAILEKDSQDTVKYNYSWIPFLEYRNFLSIFLREAASCLSHNLDETKSLVCLAAIVNDIEEIMDKRPCLFTLIDNFIRLIENAFNLIYHSNQKLSGSNVEEYSENNNFLQSITQKELDIMNTCERSDINVTLTITDDLQHCLTFENTDNNPNFEITVENILYAILAKIDNVFVTVSKDNGSIKLIIDKFCFNGVSPIKSNWKIKNNLPTYSQLSFETFSFYRPVALDYKTLEGIIKIISEVPTTREGTFSSRFKESYRYIYKTPGKYI